MPAPPNETMAVSLFMLVTGGHVVFGRTWADD